MKPKREIFLAIFPNSPSGVEFVCYNKNTGNFGKRTLGVRFIWYYNGSDSQFNVFLKSVIRAYLADEMPTVGIKPIENNT